MGFAERYPKGFVESAREQFVEEARRIVESYRGAVLEATTTMGERARYFYPSQDTNVCRAFPSGSEATLTVRSAACDGDPNPPCFLGFSLYIVPDQAVAEGPVPIESEFANKIVYTTNAAFDASRLQRDCERRRGVFNACGSLCDDRVTDMVCPMVCAFTCELNHH